MEAIGAAFYSVYTDPVHVASYNSREGGYLVPTTDTHDAVHGLFGGTFSDEFHEWVADAIFDQTWIVCDISPYRMSDREVLASGWKGFVSQVKHRSRYFFSVRADREAMDDEEIAPADFLDHLSRMISNSELVRDSHEKWFRARIHGAREKVDCGAALGTPPEARFSNRMSPAGIGMFYGALERDTALDEVTDPDRPSLDKQVTSGVFTASRPLRVLDLRHIPTPPSFFDLEKRSEYVVRKFLMGFVEDLAKPIAKNGMEHIEYVPTQVVTEYFRRVYRDRGQQSLDGIVFPSSRRDGGACSVLFFEHEQCVDDDGRTDRAMFVTDWLVLECGSLETRDAD